jgi:MOSC domain-containing protein YiiM
VSDRTAQAKELFVAVARRKSMQPVEQVEVIANRGFAGCEHGRPGSRRQVLLVESETLAQFGLSPGVLRENIATEGLRHRNLFAGQRLIIGDAILQITGPCEPCQRLEEIRSGLQQELDGRRGTLCRVIKGGTITSGDCIVQTAGFPDAEALLLGLQ